MCKEAVRREAYTLRYVPDYLKTQEMCEDVIHVRPEEFFLIPDCFKTQEMCERAVEDDPSSLQYFPDWFGTQEQIGLGYDDDEDNLFKWYEGYKKRKAQKASIKEELMPIAWQPSRWWDWCMQKMKKGIQKHCGHKHGPFFVSCDRIPKMFF